MKIKIFCLFIGLFLNGNIAINLTQAQSNTDSLLVLYHQAIDTVKLKIGFKIVNDLLFVDPKKAHEIATSNYHLAQQLNDLGSIASCQNHLGILNRLQSKNEAAKEYFQRAIRTLQVMDDTSGIISIHNNLGNTYYSEGKYVDALHFYLIADSLNHVVQDPINKARIHSNIASVFADLSLFEYANKHLLKAYNEQFPLNERAGIANFIAFNLLELDKTEEAKPYLNIVDSAMQNKPDIRFYGEALCTQAYYHVKTGDTLSAKQLLMIAADTLPFIEDRFQNIVLPLQMAMLCLKLDEHKSCLDLSTYAYNKYKKSYNKVKTLNALKLRIKAGTGINDPNVSTWIVESEQLEQEIQKDRVSNLIKILNIESLLSKAQYEKERWQESAEEREGIINQKSITEKISFTLIFSLLCGLVLLYLILRKVKFKNLILSKEKDKISKDKKTEKEKYIDELKEKERLLDLVFAKSGDLVVLFKVTETSNIVVSSINATFDTLNYHYRLNLKKEQFIGKTLEEVVNRFQIFEQDMLPRKQEIVKTVINTLKPITYEAKAYLGSHTLTYEAQVEPIISEKRTCRHLLFTLRDVSERTRIENLRIQSMLKAEDMERKRIAKDLHDGLGQNLTAAQLYLDGVIAGTEYDNERDEKLKKARLFLHKGLEECRSISHNLIPKTIDDLGLLAALKQLTDNLNQISEIGIQFISNTNTNDFPINTSLNLYRMIQEALNNAIKYSKASQITVQLLKFEDIYTVTIEDDGVGFDLKLKLEEKTFGLQSFLNRCELIHAKLNIDTQPGKGTVISIEINQTTIK